MLRYLRKSSALVHEVGLPAHRAMPDAYVTAHHLPALSNATSIDKLLQWNAEHGLFPRIPSGQDRGKSWDRLSSDTLLEYLRDRDVDTRFNAQSELGRRGEVQMSDADEPPPRSLL